MPKPTTGRIDREEPQRPDPDELAASTLMTSVWSGVSLVVATLVLATFGSVGLFAGRAAADVTGAKVGLLVGLLVGALVIGLMLRLFSDRIRARSSNLYRGAWIGTLASLAIILVMAYAPQLIPNYCPPGGIC